MIELKPIQLSANSLVAISHENKERILHEFMSKNLEDIYLHYINPARSEVIFLLKDGVFKRGTIVNNVRDRNKTDLLASLVTESYRFSIVNDVWDEGHWTSDEAKIHLKSQTHNETLNINKENDSITSHNDVFMKITDHRLIEQAIMFHSELTNRSIMTQNLRSNIAVVNKMNFGEDCVFKNFDYVNPLTVE